MMKPRIKELVLAYKAALDNLSHEAHQPGAYYQGRPEPEVEQADQQASHAARELAEAMLEALDEEPMEEPGLVRALRVEIVDTVAGARQLYGENAALIAGQPLPPHDFRYVLVGQNARTTIHAGAAVSAEFLVQYETARMAERGLQLCGCLINDGGAHRVGCPNHPEGVKGDRL